jgi:hypothetical protein
MSEREPEGGVVIEPARDDLAGDGVLDPEHPLAKAGFLTVAPPAAPPIGWSSHDEDID